MATVKCTRDRFPASIKNAHTKLTEIYYCFLSILVQLNCVSPDFNRFLLGFHFIGFRRVKVGFDLMLPVFTEFSWVLPGFTAFY